MFQTDGQAVAAEQHITLQLLPATACQQQLDKASLRHPRIVARQAIPNALKRSENLNTYSIMAAHKLHQEDASTARLAGAAAAKLQKYNTRLQSQHRELLPITAKNRTRG